MLVSLGPNPGIQSNPAHGDLRMILYQTEDIRKKIQSVVSVEHGRRYAIVAFVVQDALDFVRNPAGLTVAARLRRA